MDLRSFGQEQVLRLLLLLVYPPAPFNTHGHDAIIRISGQQKDAGQFLKGMSSSCVAIRGVGNFKLVHDSVKPPLWSRRYFVAKFV